MSMTVRRLAAAAAVSICALMAPPAVAQTPGAGSTPKAGNGEPFDHPRLGDEFPGGSGSQLTPTPSPTATRTSTSTPTPRPTATPRPDDGKNNGEELPDTGTDPLRVGLMGLTLLGFGLSLRLRVALADARRRD